MTRTSCFGLVLAVVVSMSSVPAAAGSNDKLVVHEWGTFTALQNERGEQLAGINIDDEPVPKFVHNLNPFVLQSSYTLREVFSKGAPQRHPYVTVRLETPVIYFYPPGSLGSAGASPSPAGASPSQAGALPSQRLPMKVDVDVSFRGGWLTEFYPRAEATAPGLKENSFEFGPITSNTVSRLSWRDVTIGTDRAGPETTENVWTAPRKTESTPVATPEGEAEKYLFYRGVGNFNAPLRVTHNSDTGKLAIFGNFDNPVTSSQQMKINGAWLVHIRKDGRTAFRRISDFQAAKDAHDLMATANSRFDDADYASANIEKLRTDMHQALVADGLLEDEAHAMLRTWDRAYFQKPGLRLFYTVPRAWTDYQLPLQVSVPAQIERVMMGRIELISDEQRATLDRLSQTAISKPDWISKIFESPNARSFLTGHSDFGDLGVQVPPDYQMYLDLGRFRNALVIARLREQPTDSLQKFVSVYQLEQFQVPGDPALAAQPTRAAGGGQ